MTISNSQCVWLGFFSLKHSSTFVGNEGIYRIGAKCVSQSVQASRTACLAGVSREGLTRERQLSPPGLTLRIPACTGHMIHFAGS